MDGYFSLLLGTAHHLEEENEAKDTNVKYLRGIRNEVKWRLQNKIFCSFKTLLCQTATQ